MMGYLEQYAANVAMFLYCWGFNEYMDWLFPSNKFRSHKLNIFIALVSTLIWGVIND